MAFFVHLDHDCRHSIRAWSTVGEVSVSFKRSGLFLGARYVVSAAVRLAFSAFRIASAKRYRTGRLLRRLVRSLAARYGRRASKRFLARLGIYGIFL